MTKDSQCCFKLVPLSLQIKTLHPVAVGNRTGEIILENLTVSLQNRLEKSPKNVAEVNHDSRCKGSKIND